MWALVVWKGRKLPGAPEVVAAEEEESEVEEEEAAAAAEEEEAVVAIRRRDVALVVPLPATSRRLPECTSELTCAPATHVCVLPETE